MDYSSPLPLPAPPQPPPPPSLVLRRALPSDAQLVVTYVKELATYEREPDAAILSEADILQHAFGSESPLVKIVLAEWDGQSAGFALWFNNFSTWQGIGRTLIKIIIFNTVN